MPDDKDKDFSFIDPGDPPTAGGAANELYAKELSAYDAFSAEDDAAFERRAKYAYLLRELSQIDDIVASRKDFANRIFKLVVWWLVGVGYLLCLVGWSGVTNFNLDVKVVLAIVGGTTLNVLGIFTIVTNFLFPKNGHSIFSRGERTPPKVSPSRSAPKRTAKPKEPVDESTPAN